jgi:putative transposase
MSGIIKIKIWESELELLELLKQWENQEVKERIQALYWLKTKQVESTGAIASLVGKHRTTVSRWLSRYRRGGIKTLLHKGKSSGRKSEVTPELENKILIELRDPEGFSSYKEVQRWLKVMENVEMSYSGVHNLIRYRLKAKLKIPRPVHVKQEPGAVNHFKKN